jgi:glutamate/tyrosine decarboxylase-like PLP-dependent enzyme
MDVDALAERIGACERDRQPVLLVVGVLGTTEYGSVDPVEGICDARDQAQARGFGAGVHVDAAWGGYLASLFRNPDGSLRTRDEVAEGFEAFPSTEVHAAFAALARTDSITVDPHKLGYLPYGAGAFVCRDHRAMALLAEGADYVFHGATPADYLAHYRSLGLYTIEGSKPGAAAAAGHVTHKVLPLDHTGFGQLQRHSIEAAEAFHAGARALAMAVADVAAICIPFAPDTNLVCMAVNPRGNRSVEAASDFVRALHDGLRSNPRQPLQSHEFFGSVTSLHLHGLGAGDRARILGALGLDAPAAGDDDGLVVLRHTLMNPYLIDRENGISYIDLYFAHLEQRIRARLR